MLNNIDSVTAAPPPAITTMVVSHTRRNGTAVRNEDTFDKDSFKGTAEQ